MTPQTRLIYNSWPVVPSLVALTAVKPCRYWLRIAICAYPTSATCIRRCC